jgi:hypothetical protein
VLRERTRLPAPGPVDALYETLRQPTDQAAVPGLSTPVFGGTLNARRRLSEAPAGASA